MPYKYPCPHGKHKAHCKECGGSGICIHGKRKVRCRECGGSAFCKHDKQKANCRECGGSAFCEHDKDKYRCKDCTPSSFCMHDKFKAYCKDCDGSAFCVHGNWKAYCKECGGHARCEHVKIRGYCRECNGSAFCEHSRQKNHCKECNGSAICIHKKEKAYCKECHGSAICKHDKQKAYCKGCGGSSLCKTPGCETVKSKNASYDGHCLRCFVHLFPEKPNARNYKTKERAVVEFLETAFSGLTFVTDKKVEDGCSKRRPDVLIDFGDQVLCIEIDENMHIRYDCSCENKRLMEISRDVGHRPLVFLRFNPDSYTNEKGMLCRSPWGINKMGLCIVKRAGEWTGRLTVLQEHVQYWIEHRIEKTIEVVELFYDMNTVEGKEVEDDGRAAGGAGV